MIGISVVSSAIGETIPPEPSLNTHITTESGQIISTENGDQIIVEDNT